jgi:site-specific DNA-cytosine methylase
MFSNRDHIDFRNYFGDSFVNFDRKNDISGGKSELSKSEILGLKINTSGNNSDYTPKIEEPVALKTGTDNVEIETEFLVKLGLFVADIQNELSYSENKCYKLTDTVSICAIENNSFKYKGNWKSIHSMKFEDLQKLYMSGVEKRQDIVKNNNVSGLARQHASYFFKALKMLEKIEIDSSAIAKESGNNTDYTPVEDYSLSLGTAFSGMGSAEYVLKHMNINHRSEFVCDINKYCREVLAKNYNPQKIYSDIRMLNGYEHPSTDLYVWGSPCQDLSILNNKRQGLKGNQSSLFFEGYRVLKELQPKYSIFENVPGLLSSQNGEDFKLVMELFKELNYEVYFKKLNPVKLGGYTNRIRVFFVLVRKDIAIPFHFPKESGSIKPIKDILIEGEYQYFPDNQFVAPDRPFEKQRGLLKTVCKWLGDKWNMYNRVFDIETSACPTINRKGFVLINTPKGKRQLTIPELIRAQGFSNDVNFIGISDRQIKSMLGNTIEATTMRLLIEEIVRIDKLYYHNQKEPRRLLVS